MDKVPVTIRQNYRGGSPSYASGRQGSVLLEFAIGLPVFLFVIFSTVYFGITFVRRHLLMGAIQTAGRQFQVIPYEECTGSQGIDATVRRLLKSYYAGKLDALRVNLFLDPESGREFLEVGVVENLSKALVPSPALAPIGTYKRSHVFPLADYNQGVCGCDVYPDLCPP